MMLHPRLTLCTCGHERRAHGPHGCRVPAAITRLGNGPARLRRCPCLRFVEAEFRRQQMPLFAHATTERSREATPARGAAAVTDDAFRAAVRRYAEAFGGGAVRWLSGRRARVVWLAWTPLPDRFRRARAAGLALLPSDTGDVLEPLVPQAYPQADCQGGGG